MYSLNVKAHLESLIASYLSAFVEEYDSTSLSIGIWQGHIKLTNLKLKPLSLDARDDLPVKLEFGMIGEMQIIVPWAQLQSGNITVIVDKVHLVVRCFSGGGVSGADASQDSLAFQRKLTQLDAKERSMLGEGESTKSPSFASRIIESFTSSLMSNVMNGSSISVSDIRVSVLSPLSHEGEELHIRLGVEAISIKKDTSDENFHKKNAEYSLKKHIEVHGISLEISRKSVPVTRADKEAFLALLGSEPPQQLVLNPVHLNLYMSLWRGPQEQYMTAAGTEHHVTGAGAEVTPQTLSLDCNISNFELTPHMSHLYLVQEGLDQAKFEMARRFGGLRPAQPPSATLNNTRAWWRYTISAVLRHVYGEAYVYKAICGSERDSVTTQRSLRNRYIFLYCQLIEQRILRRRAGAEISLEDNKIQSESVELNELHKTIAFDKLVLYRAIVHQTECGL